MLEWKAKVDAASHATNATEQKALAAKSDSAPSSKSSGTAAPAVSAGSSSSASAKTSGAKMSAGKSGSSAAAAPVTTSAVSAAKAAGSEAASAGLFPKLFGNWETAFDDLSVGTPPSDDITLESAWAVFVSGAKELRAKVAKGETPNEVEDVQPFVATLISAVVGAVRKEHGIQDLQVYAEVDDKAGKERRKSDCIVYLWHSRISKLNEAMRAAGVVTIEAKNLLTQPKSQGAKLSATTTNDGVNGLQRDYMDQLTGPAAVLPYGLGIVSDGADLFVVRTKVGERAVESVCSRLYQLDDAEDLRQAVALIGRMLVVAARRSYTYEYALPKMARDGTEVAITQILAASSNSTVFRCSVGQRALVAKRVCGETAAERVEAEVRVWRDYGARLNMCEHFVKLDPLSLQWCRAALLVYADDNAASLRQVRKIAPEDQSRLSRLLSVVTRDIGAALKHLHGEELAFVDLHPGQIVVTVDASGVPQSAKLVDVETIQKFESEALPNRRKWCVSEYEPRWMERRAIGATTDAESFVLVLAWLLTGKASAGDRQKSYLIRHVEGDAVVCVEFDQLKLCEPLATTPITVDALARLLPSE
jgi:hypothetical protein